MSKPFPIPLVAASIQAVLILLFAALAFMELRAFSNDLGAPLSLFAEHAPGLADTVRASLPWGAVAGLLLLAAIIAALVRKPAELRLQAHAVEAQPTNEQTAEQHEQVPKAARATRAFFSVPFVLLLAGLLLVVVTVLATGMHQAAQLQAIAAAPTPEDIFWGYSLQVMLLVVFGIPSLIAIGLLTLRGYMAQPGHWALLLFPLLLLAIAIFFSFRAGGVVSPL